MNDMGQVVNVGFEDDKFYGSDFTGERLDSETRIAYFFVVKLTALTQSLPKYWKNPRGINTLIQSEIQTALSGLTVWVCQIETGMHIMQVVVDGSNTSRPGERSRRVEDERRGARASVISTSALQRRHTTVYTIYIFVMFWNVCVDLQVPMNILCTKGLYPILIGALGHRT